jgi:hypothetical protein
MREKEERYSLDPQTEVAKSNQARVLAARDPRQGDIDTQHAWSFGVADPIFRADQDRQGYRSQETTRNYAPHRKRREKRQHASKMCRCGIT